MTIENHTQTRTTTTIKKKILVLPGDNIGPEVTREGVKVLNAVLGLRARKHNTQIDLVEGLIGGSAIDKTGNPLPLETLELAKDPETVAVLFGAIGGPQWDNSEVRPEQGISNITYIRISN